MCEIEYTEEIINVRRTVRIRKKAVGEPMEICLCPRCASQFYNSRQHFIKRADYYQINKEPCTYCNSRNGFDFLIFDPSFSCFAMFLKYVLATVPHFLQVT